jgi:hypothetical protein
MRAERAIAGAALLAAALALAGCAEGGLAGTLRSAGIAGTPDEFMVLPTRPLEMPQDLTALPPPTPGAVNRVDYRPHAEAIAGLTGRPTAATASGAALVARVGPADPNVRAQLAAEDVAWRQTHRGLLLERVFSRDRDTLVYREMLLNAPAEFERLRAVGVQVPAAPPTVLSE